MLLMSAGACTSRTMVVNQSFLQVGPTLIVERFLQAANVGDLETMSRLFGTEDGPFGDRRNTEQVELQLNLIAEILQHNDYRIVSERSVPGARVPSNRIGVDIVLPSGTTVRDVGFTLVLASADQWLINAIDLVKITLAV